MRHRHTITGLALLVGATCGVYAQEQQENRERERQQQRQEQMERERQRQQQDQQRHQPGAAVSTDELRFMLSEKVIGMKIENASNEEVGELSDLIVNAQDGRVTHAVVSFGGWLGIGDSVVVVPIDQFNVKPGEARAGDDSRTIQCNTTKDNLSNYPTFKPDRWRSLRTSEWAKALDQNNQGRRPGEIDRRRDPTDPNRDPARDPGRDPGQRDPGQRDPGQRDPGQRDPGQERQDDPMRDKMSDRGARPLIRLSDISGTDVSAAGFEFQTARDEYEMYSREVAIMDEDLKKVGDIDGAVVELKTWQIPFAVVATGGAFGYGADDRLVPWQSLHMVNGKIVVTGITHEDFKNLEVVEEKEISRLNDESRLTPIYSAFGMTMPKFTSQQSGRDGMNRDGMEDRNRDRDRRGPGGGGGGG